MFLVFDLAVKHVPFRNMEIVSLIFNIFYLSSEYNPFAHFKCFSRCAVKHHFVWVLFAEGEG